MCSVIFFYVYNHQPYQLNQIKNMYSESVIRNNKRDINSLKRQLITDFGVDEPVRLVNTEFQKRFQLAQTKYNIIFSFPDKSRDLEKMEV